MEYQDFNGKMIESFLEKFKKLNKELPSQEIIKAFYKVPRHFFTPFLYEEKDGSLRKRMFNYKQMQENQLKQVYIDTPIVVLVEDDKVIATSSQPFVMAMMLMDAKVKEGAKVLEIGTGSGYNAAILAEIVKDAKKIVSTEIKTDVANLAKDSLKRAGYENIKVIAEDGGKGFNEEAPYDSIIITCGAPEIPMHEQVSDKGTISLPLVTHGMETLCSLTKENDKVFRGYLNIYVRFLHFDGIYSDRKQFAKSISSLQRVIENYGKKRDDLKQNLTDLFVEDSDSEEEKNRKRKAHADFQFFLAISEEDAILYQSKIANREAGYALWHIEAKQPNNGLVVMFNNEIVSWGNESVSEKLLRKYEEWKGLGSPGLSNYIIEFFPSKYESLRDNLRSWIVPRKIGVTRFSLKGGVNA